MHMVFKVAKTIAPSVIYIDEMDKVGRFLVRIRSPIRAAIVNRLMNNVTTLILNSSGCEKR